MELQILPVGYIHKGSKISLLKTPTFIKALFITAKN